MKIDRSKLKKSVTEVPADCGWLIEKLQRCSDSELLSVLKSIESWNYGKCELHYWVNVLDRFDSIFENATKKDGHQWVLPCDLAENAQMQELVVWVLYFTTLLVEHSFSRHLYSSLEHLITLLSSSSMTIVLSVLNLLYMFSKRSNYITRMAAGPKQALLSRLIHLAESWGGKENGFGLAQCCQNLPLSSYPEGATSVHFEFYGEPQKSDASSNSTTPKTTGNTSNVVIHINNIQVMNKSPSHVMEELISTYKVPAEKQVVLFTHLRLAHSFARYESRLQCVQARLQAISILVYCNALQDNAHTVLYSGLLDEFVDVLELKNANLTEIKAATLRTLTSIIHLERYPNFPKLNTIIDVTGASSYHGFLPVMVRSCISTLTAPVPAESNSFPAPLATSLFSFLYHLASYEAGGEALVACGLMESLLSVVTWTGSEPDYITFVTRAVRVIDLITNLDMNAFQSHSGLNIFIRRLELEVAECRKDQPYVIQLSAPLGTESSTDNKSSDPIDGNDTEMPPTEGTQENSLSPMDVTEPNPSDSTKPTPPKPDGDESMKNSASETDLGVPSTSKANPSAKNRTCSPQRAALIKSMLNFLKKDIQDPGFSESMRHLMESSLPSSLKHIISNAEYYGPSLFLLATDVVTVYVFGEPSLLSSLQDNGLTDIVLHALLVKDVPATREVLASLPNVFSALCLNSRGLQAFVACKPFERLFKVLLSPDYLPAMRRRKSTDPMGDTASNLGNAMDELMRHQPSLKAQAMIAIVKLLQEVCSLGSDAHYVCCKTPQKNELPHAPTTRTTNDNSSDEEEEEEEGDGGASSSSALVSQDSVAEEVPLGDKKPVPLVDYVLNVMKFVDAILSNNSTDDHCKEFVAQKGLVPLLGILGLPNLPIDFPVSQACQAVASACKSILNLAHESGVLEQGLHCLHEKLEALAPLHNPTQGGSVLLKELSACPNAEEAINSPQSTPLLHTLSAIHAYIMMLVHVCRTGQADIRQVSIKQWGTELGLKVLAGLTKLYTSLVWESTVLLAFCSEDTAQTGGQLAKDETAKATSGAESKVGEVRDSPMEVTESENAAQTEGATSAAPSGSASTEGSKTVAQLKLVKPLLSSASRLGKALAELFGLLVKVCVGSPLRQRRGQQVTTPSTPPSPAAIAVANALSNVLQSGLSWVPPPSTPTPNIRLTFLISSVRFTNPMLFDDKKMPYHLMIQHFVKSNGLKAFFDIFHWALQPSESPSSSDKSSVDALPECTGEFLDTWLFLLEKLVNPKSMLESPHSLPAKLGFRPLLFLIQIQKMAFEAVLKLWNKKPLKNYGVKICESVLVILCSILKGESEIADRLNKEKAAAAAIAATEANTSVTPAPTMGAAVGTSTAETSDSLIPLPIPPPVPTSEPSTSTGENPPVSSSEDQAQDPLLFAPPLMVTATTAAAAAAAATAAILNPESSGVSGSAESRPLLVDNAAAPVADPFLQPLLDMGFPQERCLEAIANTTTLEQATEYLLLNSTSGAPVEGDMDFSEDEQWLHAVTMSLRESGTVTVSASPKAEEMAAPVAAEPDSDEEPLSKEELDKFTSTVLEGCLNQLDLQPQLVYKVCELLSTCVTRNGKEWKENMLRTLMAQISEEARLLTAAAANNKSQDTAEYLCTSEVAHKFAIRLHLITLLFEEMKTGCAGAVEDVNLVNVLIKLLCIAQEVLSAHPQILAASGKSGSILASPKEKEEDAASRTPKWLAPSMLLLDLYEKLAVATKRRAAVKKVTNHVWKWFDVSQVRWYSYTNSNNKIIDEAYWAGETSVRIINSRRKYTIQFHAMLQVNEETGNRRPVMICISEKRIGELKKKLSPVVPVTQASMTDTEKTEAEQKTVEMEGVKEDKETTEQTSNSTNPMECDEALTNTESEQKSEPAKIEPEEGEIPSTPQEEEEESFIIKGFEDNNKEKLIKACVGFMKLCIEPDTLHALMRLCLRLTREWENACLFSKMGGVRTLLTLNESSSFWGFQSLAALLMRHILEEPTTLKHTMKKVVRYAAGNSSGVGAKELHSLLRALAPAACRDSAVFTEAAQQCLRIDLNMAVKRNHLTTSNEDSILMKSIGSKNAVPGTATTPVSSQGYSQATDNTEPLTLIQDLLEALGMKDDDEANPSSLPNSTSVINSVGLSADERNQSFSTFGWIARQFQQLSRSSSANDMVLEVLDEQSPSEGDSAAKLITAESSKPTSDDTNVKRKKRLLSKSILCRLLAEFIRSYSGVAKIVTDHQYSAGTNDKITEDCSALAYLLDQLVNGTGESEMVNNVRVLIAALSSCNHAPDAQAIVVTEVKSCLSRVLILTENQEKHTKIQTIVGLILTMMESCPTQLNQPVNIFFKQQMGMNNIIRIMIKKNLVTDLARIPHSLDLSSPNMASTINAALKPLETVLRIVNMPSFVSVSGSKKKTTSTSEQHQPSGTSTTNSEATRAQGEENADDAENTEHDISGTGESLEPTSEANPNEDGTLVEGDEPGLEDVLDQLLEDRSRGQSVGRDSNRATPHRDGVTATVTYVIDHDVPMDIDDTLHDSRMVSHSESQFMDDDHDEDRNDEDDNDDASTGSSEDNDGDDDNEDQVEVEEDDDDEDEDGDDEDDDDDDDDDEEEEEGSSVFDQGYEDLEETFIRLPVERESSDDNLLLLPSYQQYINTIDTIIFGDRISLLDNNVSHDDAFYMTSTPNPNNTSVTSAIPNHPLFQNPREVSNPVARVANRPSRQRGVFRYQTASNPRSHSNTSTILQRLIGQGNRDMAQLTPNIRVGTQLIIGNQDLRIIQQNDDLLDTQDFENNFVGCSRSTGSGTLPSVPNALTRWMEEARVLESDSLHDAVTQVKPDLMAVLECHRDVEQAEKDKKKELEGSAPKNSTDSKSAEASAESDSNSTSTVSTSTTTVTTTSAVGSSTASTNTANAPARNLIISILEQQFSSGTGTSTSNTSPTFSGLLSQMSASESERSLPSIPYSIPEPQVISYRSNAPLTSSFSLLDSLPISLSITNAVSSMVPELSVSAVPVSSVPVNLSQSASQNIQLHSSPLMTAPVPTISNADVSSISPPIPLAPSVIYQMPRTTTAPQLTIEESMSISPTEFSLMPTSTTVTMTISNNSTATSTVNSVDQSVTINPVPRTISEAVSFLDQQQQSSSAVASEASAQPEDQTTTDQENLPPVSSSLITAQGEVVAVTSGPSTSGAATRSQHDFTAILGDIEIPEGVDPSFLAALPEEMRQEVISEQLRIQRVRERATANSNTTEQNPPDASEVSAEFLAALPPNIQEEVLSQQRAEQQRQQAARANPDDPTSFLLSLPQSLRQTILADLEDSQFSALPTEVVQEAQTLRRQREDRTRHVHDHMFNPGGSSSISHILRTTARMGPRFMHSPSWSSWGTRQNTGNQQVAASSSKVRGQQVLDHESLSCLLILLFVDEPKLNTTRLHRVLKSLCQHPPTRDWVIKTLLSILSHCAEQQCLYSNGKSLNESEAGMSGLSLEISSGKKGEKGTPSQAPSALAANNGSASASLPWKPESRTYHTPFWLSMSMDAALGCRASIFQIQRQNSGGKKTSTPSTSSTSVHIHQQAAPMVCRHAIDLLISLAKIFPSHFLPSLKETEESQDKKSNQTPSTVVCSTQSGTTPKTSSKSTAVSPIEPTDFWDLLVKLDSVSVSRKGKGLPRTHSTSTGSSENDIRATSLENSPLGQLIQQLAHPVIKRSSLLTDRLLRLLALVSLGHSDTADAPKPSTSSNESTKALEHLLGLSIEVLTSKSCSEEGLEDATALLLHLSHGPPPARDLVLKLLLQGSTTLGQTVTVHISSLLDELKRHNKSHPSVTVEEEPPQQSDKNKKKGLLRDRFTCDDVVISSSVNKTPCEVQLPSMSALTSKTSSQAFFLRTLKVIIQLREAIRPTKNRKKPLPVIANQTSEPESASASANQAEPSAAENPEPAPETPTGGVDPPTTTPSQSMELAPSGTAVPESQEQEQPEDPATTAVPDPLTADSVLTINHETVQEMEVDTEEVEELKSLRWELGLDDLWSTLSFCLVELGETADTHAVLVLQPAVEAFFLVHASAAVPDKKSKPATPQETREAQLAHLHHEIAPLSPLPASALPGEENVSEKEVEDNSIASDAEKFLKFAEKHRSVLNQILRQSTTHLADGPFSVLVDHTRLLDFDIKRKYFRTELERADDGIRREDLAVHVRREHVFEDSFRELHRRSPDEWKNRFYIVFEGEEGQDAGGLLREWYVIISREIFNPMYALFCTSPGDRVTYMINPSSHCNSNHLSYFKFVGRVIAKAIYDNKLLECYFTRSFYKHILGVMVRVADMESEDYSFYQGLIYLLEHHVADLGYELTFSTEVQEFGVTEARDLKPGGRNILVTEETKHEYIRLVCQEKMTGAIKKQLNSFLEGFYDIIPKRLISIFNEQELELLLSGLPTIDIDDLKNNTEYHKYHPNSLQIQWFWRALRSFDQAERAKLVQFVTGTSKVPLQGFSALEGMNGTQKFQIHRDDRSTDRLPSAHTCFNQLDLPAYETYDKLRVNLLKAVQECSEGFGFA